MANGIDVYSPENTAFNDELAKLIIATSLNFAKEQNLMDDYERVYANVQHVLKTLTETMPMPNEGILDVLIRVLKDAETEESGS